MSTNYTSAPDANLVSQYLAIFAIFAIAAADWRNNEKKDEKTLHVFYGATNNNFI